MKVLLPINLISPDVRLAKFKSGFFKCSSKEPDQCLSKRTNLTNSHAMKKLLFICFLLTSCMVVKGQHHGFMNSSLNFTIDSLNKVQLLYSVGFTGGNGGCPFLTRYNKVVNNDSIKLELFYDDRYGGTYFPCTQTDTLSFNLTNGNYCFFVNTNIIQVGSGGTFQDSVIYVVNSDTVCNISVSLNENVNSIAPEFTIYPNPTNDYLFIETEEGKKVLAVEIYNLQGQLVKEVLFKKGDRIDVSKLRRGLYHLRLIDPGNQIQSKKLYIY